jgi:hypothetical protein
MTAAPATIGSTGASITLRPYQQEAVEAVYRHLREHDDNPCVVLPTASGKTHVMATICRDAVQLWNGRVLILAHVKELLEQAVEKLRITAPDLPFGIYSAGLKQRDLGYPVTIAGIQSVYKRACELGPVDLVIVDECHLIPQAGEGMYRQFLAEAKVVNPHVRVIGLTATPFRMTTGTICAPDNILNAVCYEVGVKELIVQGYLCPLRSKAGQSRADTSNLHVRGGEYIAGEVEDLMDDDALVESACAEIVEQTRERNAVLIFASGVQHGRHIARVLADRHGVECGFVCGETPPRERAELLDRFKQGDLKYLANVNVLTTGFDAPNIDCVAMLRPTMSPGLYYQMCLDMETEVLTPTGWKRCEDIAIGDEVATFDLDTSEIVWCRGLDKVHRPLAPGERMYGMDSPHLSIRVTDGHTMVYRGRGVTCRNWRTATARRVAELKDSYFIPVAGSNDGPGLPLSDDEIRFIGWALTDGYTDNTHLTIVISQSVASQHNEAIRSMLEGCGFGYRVYRRPRKGALSRYADGLQYVIPFGKPRGKNAGRRGWSDLAPYLLQPVCRSLAEISQRQVGVLLEAMNLANGSKPRCLEYAKRTMSISVGSHRFLADQLQSLLVRRGYRCNMAQQRQKTPWVSGEPRTQYILHVRRQTRATIGGVHTRGNALVPRRSRLQEVAFDPHEWVWCLTTPHGTLVTRRHGKVAVVGNCGRGFRLHPGKTDCLVLDFGGNVLRHGPVDDLQIKEPGHGDGEAPAKECPECQAVIHAAYATCPECGHEFPPPDREQHDASASTAGVLTGQVEETTHRVSEVYYSVHTKRGAEPDHPRSMRVEYRLGFNDYISEWVCFEHTGYARAKAEQWWRKRSNDPIPSTAEEAVDLCERGCVAETHSITVRRITGEKYDRIVDWELGSIPPRLDGSDERDDGNLPEYVLSDDEVPF